MTRLLKVSAELARRDATISANAATIATKQATSQRGAASGYAPLDAVGEVPKANLPFQFGVATLVSGVATVTASYVSTTVGACLIMLTRQEVGSRPAEVYAATADFVDGTSFVIRSAGGASDNGTVAWQVWRTV